MIKQWQRKWRRWFLSLKPGDTVLINLPWNDRDRSGGRLVKAKVGHTNHNKKFLYRNRHGVRQSTILSTWYGDCYHHVMPLDRELDYDPRRGFILRKRNIGYHRYKS